MSATHSPGIRRLVWTGVALFAAVAIVGVTILVGEILMLERIIQTAARDTQSAATAAEIKVSALEYQRLSNLSQITGEPALTVARAQAGARLRALVAQAVDSAGAAHERGLIQRISAALTRYLKVRAEIDTQTHDFEALVRRSRPAFTELLSAVEAWRDVNNVRFAEARARAQRAKGLSILVGIAASALLIAGFLLVGFGVRRYLARPVLTLHAAMDAFRDGDMDVRGAPQGADELQELAHMFNDMASRLAEQRRAQLEFLAGVTHDLKNPLTTLRNGLVLLESEPSEAQRSRKRDMLDDQVASLARMLDDLLDATRIEAGELELRCMPFDLRGLVEDIVQMYVPTAPNHRITAELPRTAVQVVADPLRIEQVLRNLLSNAIKYSSGGSIDVRVAKQGAQAVIEITDEGCGIAPEDVSNIFLPFQRRKLNAAPGVGLGLSVVRRIIRAHGGTIEVDSRVGQGSTFRVRLPSEDKQA